MNLITCSQLSKVYPGGSTAALDSIDLAIEEGTFTAVVGKSGSGKTTLLNLLAALDRPTGGKLVVQGTDLSNLDERALSIWRRDHVGVVFQFFQLLPTLTVWENIHLAMEFSKRIPPKDRAARVEALLSSLGILDQADKLPHTLSGGQQQRVAIARALANDPAIVVADEPTGNLDTANSQAVLEIFATLAKSGKTVVMITHETEYGQFADREVVLRDGRIARESSHGSK